MIKASLNAKALREKLASMQERLKRLDPAFMRAAIVVLKRAQDRIRSGGDGNWPPVKAPPTNRRGLVQGSTLYRTGTLFRSLTVGGSGSLYETIANGVRVGTNVPYARYQQEGTRRGIPPRPFLLIDDETAGKVVKTFARYIMTGDDNG